MAFDRLPCPVCQALDGLSIRSASPGEVVIGDPKHRGGDWPCATPARPSCPGASSTPDGCDRPTSELLGPTTIVRSVCLLVVAWRCQPSSGRRWSEPIARVAGPTGPGHHRPAGTGPRILGGRANGPGDPAGCQRVRRGVRAHQPPHARWPRSHPAVRRGRLPLLAAEARTAEEAVDAVVGDVAVGSYNPAWLLVGTGSPSTTWPSSLTPDPARTTRSGGPRTENCSTARR